MSITHIPTALRRLVVKRAGNQYEYCLLPADIAFFPHEVDHVVAEKHGGKTEADNLAFACWRCNRHNKGSDLGSFDPQTQNFSHLFNPRRQLWTEHFMFQGEQLIGLTPEGRTTVSLLRLNSDGRLAERRSLQGSIKNSTPGFKTWINELVAHQFRMLIASYSRLYRQLTLVTLADRSS